MGRCIAPEQTHATPEQAFASYRRAAPTLGPESLCVLLAQWAIESGSGGRMFCWNPNGAKAVVGGAHDWTFLTTHEVEHGQSIRYDAPPLDAQPGITAESLPTTTGRDPVMARRIRTTCFRAYPSLDAATADHVALIRSRFAPAWPYVERAEPQTYGLTLGALHYYTADRAQYAAALVAHHTRFLHQVPSWKADA